MTTAKIGAEYRFSCGFVGELRAYAENCVVVTAGERCFSWGEFERAEMLDAGEKSRDDTRHANPNGAF